MRVEHEAGHLHHSKRKNVRIQIITVDEEQALAYLIFDDDKRKAKRRTATAALTALDKHEDMVEERG
jgi:hypothetical protein